MKAFTEHRGLVGPMDRANVDTDMIIPKQFLKSIKRSGFGPNLFDELRYLDEGQPGKDCSNRPVNHNFPLNQDRYKGASVLLARKNFGCGSSREHAPACMEIAGVKAVIAQSYARIFYRNSVDGGFFIPFESVARMVEEIKTGDALIIDLNASTLTNSSSKKIYELKSLGEVIEIIEAGNIFEYARKRGMIPST